MGHRCKISFADCYLKQNLDRPSFLDLSPGILCSQCDGKELVKTARRIQPLDHLSEEFGQITRRSQPPPVLYDSDVASPEGTNQSPRSSLDAASTVGSGPSSRSSLGKISWEVEEYSLSPPASPKSKTKRLLWSYCFSADGKTLLLWIRGDWGVYTYTLPSCNAVSSAGSSPPSWFRYEVPGGAEIVAGSGGKVAAVSKVVILTGWELQFGRER